MNQKEAHLKQCVSSYILTGEAILALRLLRLLGIVVTRLAIVRLLAISISRCAILLSSRLLSCAIPRLLSITRLLSVFGLLTITGLLAIGGLLSVSGLLRSCSVAKHIFTDINHYILILSISLVLSIYILVHTTARHSISHEYHLLNRK